MEPEQGGDCVFVMLGGGRGGASPLQQCVRAARLSVGGGAGQVCGPFFEVIF